MPLPLPLDVVQPFELRYLCDDLHVMAYIDDHPVYEAVEAMIRLRHGGSHAIRVIMTRHDRTQVDHVNDAALLAAARGARRETCSCEIGFSHEQSGPSPRVRLAFLSHEREAVVLDVTAVSPPEAARAGLSNPDGHSPDSSLPVMWRGKSALAGPATRVLMGGVAYPVPVMVRHPGFVAHRGYFTESHHMAILRAGTVELAMLERPTGYGQGSQWRFAAPEGERLYRVMAIGSDGMLEISRPGTTESIRAFPTSAGLELHEVRVSSEFHPADRATLSFGGGRFSIGIDENADVVTGTWTRDADELRLTPEQPAWAQTRPVRMRMSRTAERIVLTTSIGRQAAPTV